MRIAVPLPGTMWAFDVISIIQIFDDDSVMYGSPDRPVIDFIANGSQGTRPRHVHRHHRAARLPRNLI